MKIVSETIRGIKPFFLLVIFITLSIIAFNEKELELLSQPISWEALLIPFIGMFAYGLAWGWIYLVIRVSIILPSEDLVNLGYLVACSVMVLALIISGSYLASNYQNISLEILIKPGFIYTCTLFIMSRVAFETAEA